MLRTEAYASQMGTLSVARRLFGNFGQGSTSLRGRRLKGKGKRVFGARETRGPGRARREGRKETPVSFPPSSRAPCVSLAPKTPFPFPFKRLPRRLGEYVKSLRERHTLKHSEERHPKMGELLLIKLEDKNRGKWRIGVVTDLIKGRDGVVRAAKLRVGTSCIERAVQQLFPLEFCCDRVRDEHRRTGNFRPWGAVDHLPKKLLKIGQIFTKQSKRNKGHTMQQHRPGAPNEQIVQNHLT